MHFGTIVLILSNRGCLIDIGSLSIELFSVLVLILSNRGCPSDGIIFSSYLQSDLVLVLSNRGCLSDQSHALFDTLQTEVLILSNRGSLSDIILVNARHIKNVPGRKTDIADSKWLAGLLRHGLLRGSFIPSKEIRHWRELTRLRRTYTESLADYKRRIHKLFETANIKIDSVVSDLFGTTGRNLILLLCNESELSLTNIKTNAQRGLKSKAEELHRSIHGFFEDHHRFQLIGMMETITTFEKQITDITERLDSLTAGHQNLLDRLDEIPGIDKKSAQSIVSEIGVTLDEFICMAALASWAGLCPGNNESAGKRKNGRSSVRSHPFKTILIEVAWAAVKKKGSYYRAKYFKLKSRRGAKKAIVAIAHRISKAIFNIIKHGDTFTDLGENYLTAQTRQRAINNIMKRAEQLGFELVPCMN